MLFSFRDITISIKRAHYGDNESNTQFKIKWFNKTKNQCKIKLFKYAPENNLIKKIN
jgi:hypothetical protein